MKCIDSVKPLRASSFEISQDSQSTRVNSPNANETQRHVFTVELDSRKAMAFAQFLKRLGWSEMRGCAVDDDEVYAINHAVCEMRNALAEGGFAPR